MGCGCWLPWTRSWSGAATSSAAAGPPGPCTARPAAWPPAGTSRPWSSGWLARIPAGGTEGSMASWPDQESKPQRRPSGRSSGPAAPASRGGGPGRPGHKFLRSRAGAILASDFFTAGLPGGTQACVLAVTGHASRRIRVLGVTQHPAGEQTTQQARNLIMDPGEQAHRVKFIIRDRGPDFTAAYDARPGRRRHPDRALQRPDAPDERDRRTLDRGMPPRAPRPHPHLEPGPSATDPARL